MTDHVLPYNEDAETQTVGACLLDANARDAVSEILRPEHLYLGRLSRVYKTILDLQANGTAVDALIVEQALDPRDVGAAHELVANVRATANAEHHARIVLDTHTQRRLIQVGQNIARLGWEPDGPAADTVDHAERLVSELAVERDPGELRHISQSLDETYRILDTPGGIVTGTPTGLHQLDRLTSGLQPGQLVTVAARPGMGKSALVTSTLIHNAIRKQRPAALFSIEMSEQEINQRVVSQVSGVDLMKIRTRNGLTPDDRAQIDRSRPIIEQAPIYTDDSANLRLADIRARARRHYRRHPDLALIAVDYLQLMIGEQADNRNHEIAHLSRGLKVLARELDVPVVALAQLNRNVEARHDKRPILSDLRDSGAIEQDSDLVLFLYRDDYYNPTSDRTGVTELILAKHRNGPTGMVEVTWLKDRAQFTDLAEGT